jgi:hypothetical protein
VPLRGDGRVVNDPGTPYVLAGKGVDVAGQVVARRGDLRLVRTGGTMHLRDYVTGVFPDGWSGNRATYSRFAVEPRRRPGKLTITASREGWKGNNIAAVVTMSIGTLQPRPLATIMNPCHEGVCADLQPTIGKLLASRSVTVGSGQLRQVTLRVTPPFQVELDVYPTFAPSDFGGFDNRQLGVQTQFTFAPGR